MHGNKSVQKVQQLAERVLFQSIGVSQVWLRIASGIHVYTPPADQLSAQTEYEYLGNVLCSHPNFLFRWGCCTTCNLMVKTGLHQHLLPEASQGRHTQKLQDRWELCYTFCRIALNFGREKGRIAVVFEAADNSACETKWYKCSKTVFATVL